MNDPCILCGDRCCCRGLCVEKKKWWDYDQDLHIVGKRHKKPTKTIDTNKNGIRRETVR